MTVHPQPHRHKTWSKRNGLKTRRARTADREQKGATLILNAFFILVAISALGVLGYGQVVVEKAKTQKMADMAALTAARQMDDGPDFTEAREVAALNGLDDGYDLQFECLIDGEPVPSCEDSITVRSTVSTTVEGSFLSGPQAIASVAEATNAPVVAGMVTANLADLDSSQSALLNGLLTGLGGGNVNLGVGEWRQLLGADVAIDLIKLGAELGAVTASELMAVQLDALDLINEGLVVAQAQGEANPDDFNGVLGKLAPIANQVSFPIGDILQLNLDPDATLKDASFLTANLGDLAQAALLRTVQGESYQLNVQSGLLGVSTQVTILQPPQIFIGQKLPFMSPLASGTSAQVALDVVASQNLNLVVVNASIDLAVRIKAGGGSAQIDSVTCQIPSSNNVTTMTVQPTLLDLCISDSVSNLYSAVDELQCGGPATIAQVSLLGIPIGIKLGAQDSLRSDPVTFELMGEIPPAQNAPEVELNLGQTLGNLLGNLELDLELDVPIVGGLLNLLLSPLLDTLRGALNVALSPLLATLGGILDGVLNEVGLSLNETTATALSVDCFHSKLTR